MPLEKKPFPFDELDYYVDGLLTKHLTNLACINLNKTNDTLCLIASNAFSHPFFIVHLNLQTIVKEDFIDEIASIINKTCTSEYDHLIVIQNKPNKLSNIIKKNFKNQLVEFLDIDP